MIELLGAKRAMLLGAMLGLNLLIAAAFFLFIMPMKEEADQKLATTRSEISRLQGDIQNIKSELQKLKETLPQYQALEAKGFFLDQDRFYISRTLEDMKNRSQLAAFAFTVDDIKDVTSADAEAAKRRLVASRIQIDKVMSVLDTGFYDFMNIMEAAFPSHLRVQSFEIKKSGKVDEVNLRSISEGKGSLITASLTVDWLTMIDAAPPAVPGAGGLAP